LEESVGGWSSSLPANGQFADLQISGIEGRY
jgi:hypothetical protein